MTVPVVNNVQTGGPAFQALNSTTDYTFPNYVVGAESDRVLIVSVGMEDETHIVDGITFSGVALTKIIQDQSGTAQKNFAQLWYLDNPANATADLVFSANGTVNSMGFTVRYLSGAATGGAEASNSSNGMSGSSISTAVTTLTDDAIVVDGIVDGVAGTSLVASGTGQVEDADFTDPGSGSQHGTSHTNDAAPSSVTMTWTMTVARTAHVVAAFAPVAGAAVLTDAPGGMMMGL